MRHVHGNAGLVAVNRVEEHVAQQAVRAVFQLRAGTQEPAERCALLNHQVRGLPKGEGKGGWSHVDLIRYSSPSSRFLVKPQEPSPSPAERKTPSFFSGYHIYFYGSLF